MAAHYINTIAQGLKQYDNGQHKDEYYNNIAWGGLVELGENNDFSIQFSEAFKGLTSKEKSDIYADLFEEHSDGTKNCIK